MNFKKIFCMGLVLSLAFAFSGCKKVPEKQETIRVGLMSDVAAIPFLVAQEKGLFQKENVNVELTVFKSAQERDSAIAASQLDAVSSDLISLNLLKESGSDFKALLCTDGVYKLMGNSQLKGVSDLAGKQVGLSMNTLMEYILDEMLVHNNVDVASVKKVSVPVMPARLQMLMSGEIDGAMMPEPFCTIAKNGGMVELSDAEKDLGLAPGVFLMSSSFAEKNKNGIKSFINGYNSAVDYLNKSDKKEFSQLLSEKISLTEENAGFLQTKQFTAFQLPEEAQVKGAYDWLKAKNLVKSDFSYADCIIANGK